MQHIPPCGMRSAGQPNWGIQPRQHIAEFNTGVPQCEVVGHRFYLSHASCNLPCLMLVQRVCAELRSLHPACSLLSCRPDGSVIV